MNESRRKSKLNGMRLWLRKRAAEKIAAAREVIISRFAPEPVYCRRSGAFLFMASAEMLAQAAQVFGAYDSASAEYALEKWRNSFCHPAFVDTSPARIKELMRALPHEFLVWAACLLADIEVSARDRHGMLNAVRTAPLADILEAGETARIALGLFGKMVERKRAKGVNLGKITSPVWLHKDPHDVAGYNQALRAWIVGILEYARQIQNAREPASAKPAITAGFAANIAAANGFPQFRAAHAHAHDDALLTDIHEIFADVKLDAVRKITPARKPAAPQAPQAPAAAQAPRSKFAQLLLRARTQQQPENEQ